MKIKEAEELLPGNFLQVQRSYLVNLSMIERVEHNHILVGEEKISIGQAYREEFWKRVGEK